MVEEERQDAVAIPKATTALAVRGATGSAPQAAVPKWLKGKIDSLSKKAVSFSRALTRAQSALRTAARVARDAAMSFEAEFDNLVVAQKDLDKEYNEEASVTAESL